RYAAPFTSCPPSSAWPACDWSSPAGSRPGGVCVPRRWWRAAGPVTAHNKPNNPIKEAMSHTDQEPQVDVWTDGACKGNPGPGGWGVLLKSGRHEKTLSGGEP